LPFEVDEEDDNDGGIEERRLRDCWVVNKFVLDSIKPGEGDSGELVGPNNDSLSLPILLFF